jgi:hypothetical protein
MLEGLRTINPKLFYGKFAKKRRITPKVSGNEFLEQKSYTELSRFSCDSKLRFSHKRLS